MRKEVVVGIVVALSLSAIYWALGWIGRIPDHISIPSGAVVAFNKDACPIGWGEYGPAWGRFVRGIDRSKKSIDPEGERLPGHLQEYQLQAHSHGYGLIVHNYTDGPTSGRLQNANGPNPNQKGETELSGGEETRPTNVALLYCIKQ